MLPANLPARIDQAKQTAKFKPNLTNSHFRRSFKSKTPEPNSMFMSEKEDLSMVLKNIATTRERENKLKKSFDESIFEKSLILDKK